MADQLKFVENSRTSRVHLLTVMVKVEPTCSVPEHNVLKYVHEALDNVLYEIDFNDEPEPLKMRWVNRGDFPYLEYATRSTYSQTFVRAVTKKILSGIKKKVCQKMDIANNQMQMTYTLMKSM